MIRISTLLVALAAATSLTSANPIAKGYPRPQWNQHESAKCLYLSTNLKPNSIRAIPVNSDGSLSFQGSSTMTGGDGANELDPPKLTPHAPDALGSQGSVQLADNLVFVVNAGSDTLSVLSVDKYDPTKLQLLGEPTYTNGEFPVSVAVSSELKIACVANGGAVAGLSCASYNTETGLGKFDALRPWNLGQSTPPIAPINGPAEVFFNIDESEVVVMIKGNLTATLPGFVAKYAVDKSSAQVAMTGSEVTPKGSLVLFGTALIPGTDNVLASDAGFGGLILNLDALETPIAVTNITDNVATCWAVTSPVTGTGFLDDIVVSHLVEVDLTNGDIVTTVSNMNSGQGMADMKAIGGRIYALSPGNGTAYPAAITVFDISGGRGSVKSIQNFVIDGADANAEGLAVMT